MYDFSRDYCGCRLGCGVPTCSAPRIVSGDDDDIRVVPTTKTLPTEDGHNTANVDDKTEKSEKDHDGNDTDNTGALAAGVGCTVALLVCVLLALVVWRRRRGHSQSLNMGTYSELQEEYESSEISEFSDSFSEASDFE